MNYNMAFGVLAVWGYLGATLSWVFFQTLDDGFRLFTRNKGESLPPLYDQYNQLVITLTGSIFGPFTLWSVIKYTLALRKEKHRNRN